MTTPGEKLAVIVMGVSGSGKSTVARRLAQRLDAPFIEADDLHSPEAIAKMASGTPLTDDDRWPWLDRIGAALTQELEVAEIAVATCSALKRAYRDRLRQAIGHRTLFVYLQVPRDVLAERMAHRSGHFMPADLLESQLATLEPPAIDEPAVTIPAGNHPPEETVSLILDQLRQQSRGC
jgi:gluconokinase